MGKLCVAGLMMAFIIASIEAQDYSWSAPDPNEIQDCPWKDRLVTDLCEEITMTSYYCDGSADCPNKEDEPQTGQYACNDHKCNPFLQFDCGNKYGQCVAISHRCDDEAHCKVDKEGDIAADEKNCPAGNKLCISKAQYVEPYAVFMDSRCDGVVDCKDWVNGKEVLTKEDEANCPEDYECHPDLQVKCTSGSRKCIPKQKRCDCYRDCDDGSDEGPFCGQYPWPFPF